MGVSKRRNAQLSNCSSETLIFGVSSIDFIDKLIKDNCLSLDDARFLSWAYLKTVLENHFKLNLPTKKRSITQLRYTLKSFLRKKSTRDMFFERLHIINDLKKTKSSLNDPNEKEHNVLAPVVNNEFDHTPVLESYIEITPKKQLSFTEEVKGFNYFAPKTPDTPQIEILSQSLNNYPIEVLKAERKPIHLQFNDSDNDEIEERTPKKDTCSNNLTNTPQLIETEDEVHRLVNKLTPLSINHTNEHIDPQNLCIRKLFIDTATSPIKFPEVSGKNQNAENVNFLKNLTEDQTFAIQNIVKLFDSSSQPPDYQDILLETTQTDTKLIFSNRECLEELEEDAVEENNYNVIQISQKTSLRIWKRSKTNNFYCFESFGYEKENFWVNRNMEYCLCVQTQEIITDIYGAKRVLANVLFEKGITCEFICEKSILNANALTFSSNGYCHHRENGCQIKYRIHSTKGGPEGRHLLLFLNSTVPVDHSNMAVKFPQYRGKARDCLKQNFTTPELMLQKLSKIDFNIAAKGNLQGLTTRNVLQTISSEIQKSNSMIDCELNKLMVCIQSGETETFGILIIQQNSIQIFMKDENIYEILEKIPAKSLTMHTDASGQVVKTLQCCRDVKLHGPKKAFLVHANLIKVENETITTALMISNNQNALTLGTFHSYHLTDMMLRINKCIYKRIVTDWSTANFIAILQAYNNMSVIEYLNFLYEVIFVKKTVDYSSTFIFLAICYSHFMKLISGFSKREISKSHDAYKMDGYPKKQKRLLMSFFAVIRASKTFEEIEVFFKTMCKIFCNKFLTSEIQSILKNLKENKSIEVDEQLNINETNEDKKIIEEILDEQQKFNRDTGGTHREKINWYHRFKTIYDETSSEIDNDNLETKDKTLNPYYVPGMVRRSVELYFPYLPLWSRLGHALDEDEEDQTFTNGLVESWFKYLKYDMKGPLRKRPTEFLRTMYGLAAFKRTKLKNSKFFSKNKRIKKTLKKGEKPFKRKTNKKQIKRKHESDSECNMDASQHEEKWNKPGKTPKGFKYGKTTFSSSIPNNILSVETKQHESIEPDTSFGSVELYISDDEYIVKEKEQIKNAVQNTKLSFYAKSQLVSTANYYDSSCTKILKVADFATYEWMSYNDILSINDASQQLTDVAMYCCLNVFITSNTLSNQYLVYITNPLTSLFNGKLTKKEQNRLQIINQWMDLFVDPNIVHICPFLVSQTSQNNHWVLAIIDFKNNIFNFFDSLALYDGKTFFRNFLKFLKIEAKDNKQLTHFRGNWSLKNHKITTQEGVTCGKHVLGYFYKYIRTVPQLINEHTFKNVDPNAEGLRFSKIIYENAENRKNHCLRCQEIFNNDVKKHECIVCGYGVHLSTRCFTTNDFVFKSTNDVLNYVCYTCVNYIKKNILVTNQKQSE